MIANEIVSAVPANTDTITLLQVRDSISGCINTSRDFMTRHAWILKPGPKAFFDQNVAVTNSAGFDFHSDLSGAGLGDLAVH